MQATKDVVERDHPEIAAGGYAQDDSMIDFYQRVMAVLPEGAVILDLGAGRGQWAQFSDEEFPPFRHWLYRLGKKYSRRIGADVIPEVKSNMGVDEAVVIEAGKPLPFPDQNFDLILCDWVLEHIEDPQSFAEEVRRVLKVGGWFCARTSNRWSYFAIGSRILSDKIGKFVLRWLQPWRDDRDTFQTYYRLNTLSALAKHFPPSRWINASYIQNENLWYHGNRWWMYHTISIYQKLMPRSLGSYIMVFVRKIS